MGGFYRVHGAVPFATEGQGKIGRGQRGFVSVVYAVLAPQIFRGVARSRSMQYVNITNSLCSDSVMLVSVH